MPRGRHVPDRPAVERYNHRGVPGEARRESTRSVMFANWKLVRCKAAENALNEGRLDEAYERLTAPDLRGHKRAAALVNDLAQALLARARLHAQAGRYREALADLDRVDSLGESGEEARTLRKRVETEQRCRADRHRENDRAFEKAARNIHAGRLETGRKAVEKIEDAARREQLLEELDIREHRSDQLLQQAAAALANGDVLTAVRFWEEAVSRHGRTTETDGLISELAAAFRNAAESALREGRLDELSVALKHLDALAQYAPALAEFAGAERLVRQATAALAAADYDALRDTLNRLRASAGDAKWIDEGLKAVETILAGQAELLRSPLGLLGLSTRTIATQPERPNDAAAPHAGEDGAPLDASPLLLIVDGSGSSLLLTHDVARIGRAGVRGIEVPIPADLHSHHADIHRQGEDYFLIAHGPATVNRRPVQRVLLRDGDRVVLGSAGKFVFHKPSAKSATAVLRLHNRCRLDQD
ncbi:MAG: FHA domain-containing protein, partial [Planctomycetota bacterium]